MKGNACHQTLYGGHDYERTEESRDLWANSASEE
jgi:hypothetical protein